MRCIDSNFLADQTQTDANVPHVSVYPQTLVGTSDRDERGLLLALRGLFTLQPILLQMNLLPLSLLI